jgi:hypothetical protein
MVYAPGTMSEGGRLQRKTWYMSELAAEGVAAGRERYEGTSVEDGNKMRGYDEY